MPEAGSAVARVTIDESDVLYEEDIQRNPFEVKKNKKYWFLYNFVKVFYTKIYYTR